MNPLALIAQSIVPAESSSFMIWALLALLLILDIAIIIFLFRVGFKRNAILTDYEETQIYNLTKRALIKGIEEYENGKLAPKKEEAPKKEVKIADKPKSSLKIPYRRRN